jgi:zinc protease
MKKNSIKYLLLIMALLAFSESGFAQKTTTETTDKKLPVDQKVKIGKLPNGITYYIRKNSLPEKRAELRLVLKAGSILENEDQQGLAHFAEHMAFNGTKNFKKNELVDILELSGVQFGADLNAYTSFDETVYMLAIPTDSANIVKKSFQVLEDWAHQVSFEDAEIEKERGVVIEEWRLGRGADARMRDKYFPTLLYNSQYAKRLPIGKKDILETFKPETLRQFYKDWYRPDLMAIVAVGDFDEVEMENYIKKHFSNIPAYKKARPRTEFKIPDHKETLVAIEKDKEAQYTYVQIYYKHPETKVITEQAYKESLSIALFNTMLNSRINEYLQTANPPFLFASSSYGGFIGDRAAYTMFAVPSQGQTVKSIEILLQENERVRKFGFLPSEMDRAKKTLMASMEKAYAEREKVKHANFASEYVQNFLEQSAIPGTEYKYNFYKQNLDGITLPEINALAGKFITKENRIVVITGPESNTDIPTKETVLGMIDKVNSQNITPYEEKLSGKALIGNLPPAGKIISERNLTDVKVKELTLSNGAKVLIKPTDFKNDEILFSAFSKGGHSLYPDQDYFSAANASGIISRSGVGEFTQVDLGKMLAGKIVKIAPNISELTEGFNGSASPKDLETLLQLVHLYFTAPRKDSVAFLSFVSQQKGIVENRGATPQGVFYDSISVITSGNHYRRRPTVTADLQKINLDRAYAIFKERFSDASDFTFMFTGNVDTVIIRPLLEKYIASLPGKSSKENFKDVGVYTPKGKIDRTIRKGSEPQSQVQLIFSGDFDWNYDNRFVISRMAKVLNIKLRESLREDKGGVYGVGVSPVPSRFPRPEYKIYIGFGCAPEKVDSLVSAVFVEIEKLKKNGATETDLAKVKETDRRERETQVKENAFWQGQVQSAYLNDEGKMEFMQFSKKLEALTSKDIKDAANKFFDMKNYIRVVLNPETQK